ncbi:Melibiose operon regulatory protein [Clostridium sp. C105KSO15]|nr:Melibiose operon regulatory protein [Clostridium sp. C105KSO15]
MTDIVRIQSLYCSDYDQRKLCSFDTEVIENPTKPLIHQMSRLLFINRGEGVLRLQEREYDLMPGAFVAILPWQISAVVAVKKTLQYDLIRYYFDGVDEIVKSFYNAGNEPITLVQDLTNRPVVYCSRLHMKEMRDIFAQIRNETGMEAAMGTAPPKDLSNIYVMNKLVELIIQFYRIGREDAISYQEASAVTNKADIFQYIYNHLSEKLTLKMLSSLFYMSESTISAYITKTTGFSFFDLINEMRIGKTVNFLLYTDFTMEELAEILGFVDSSHISKVFMARVGMKANQYRKTYQKVNDICKVRESKNSYVIISYIYRNYSEELTLRLVAERFCISIRELNQILLYQVEKNFEEFLNFIRVNRASELLLSTEKSITDIAIEVGYNSAKTLNRNFIKFRLMTPSQFRLKVEMQLADL